VNQQFTANSAKGNVRAKKTVGVLGVLASWRLCVNPGDPGDFESGATHSLALVALWVALQLNRLAPNRERE
jgi:hypothetical protein